ncbi:hypothetical protein [Longimicrobium sp.]|uniref:hypothetical protein n=1 Tax=Longimicrobium sp. TaxID=2029185 RepID=UPI002E33221F|nr:hypothetical protein [Longimicrobium sp.]HEX6039692.1 hypothetical protein [Longimicrobium sp.]
MMQDDDLISRNELAKFLEELQKLADRYPTVVKGAEFMLDVTDDDAGALNLEGAESFDQSTATSAKASGCNPPCPPGMRCVLLFPSLRRVCVKR